MQAAQSLTPKTLVPFLLNVAPVLPVFIWGPPGIGKSALVRQFAEAVGLPCVSLLGSQLAPEDIIALAARQPPSRRRWKWELQTMEAWDLAPSLRHVG